MTIRTACGGTITITERGFQHLAAHPDVLKVLPEAIGLVHLPQGGMLESTVELGRIIGRAGLVSAPAISMNESALFAKRKGRDYASRVLLGEGEETSTICVIARPDRRPATYLLVTAFVGKWAPKEPWDRNLRDDEKEGALSFWSHHALAYDSNVMDEPFESTWNEVLASSAL